MESLRKPSSYFLINLAVSDFLLLSTNIPISIYNSINKRWMFGQEGKEKINKLFSTNTINTIPHTLFQAAICMDCVVNNLPLI